MKAFLQNEIRLFFSRKNYLVWIVGVLAVVFAYRLYYVTQYENYAQTVLEELEENAKDITIWESEYQRQCMELWGDNSAEKFAHASFIAKCMETVRTDQYSVALLLGTGLG